MTPTAFSGPHSPACLSQLWKKAIGKDRRTIDWMKYSKNAYWNTRGYPAVLSDMKAWKAYTRSSDYATAVKGGLMCYGKKPDRYGVLWLKSSKRRLNKDKMTGKGWEMYESKRTQEENLDIFQTVKKLFDLENPNPTPFINEFKTTVKRKM